MRFSSLHAGDFAVSVLGDAGLDAEQAQPKPPSFLEQRRERSQEPGPTTA